MLTSFPKLFADGAAKSLTPAAVRASHELSAFARKAAVALTRPTDALDMKHIDQEGARELRRKAARNLLPELDRLQALVSAAADEQRQAKLALDQFIESRFAAAGKLETLRAQTTVAMLGALPFDDPRVHAFRQLVESGDRDATLAALIAPIGSSIAGMHGMARERVLAEMPVKPGDELFGRRVYPDVHPRDSIPACEAAGKLVELHAQRIRATLESVADKGHAPQPTAADLMDVGNKLSPLLAELKRRGVTTEQPEPMPEPEPPVGSMSGGELIARGNRKAAAGSAQ
jgi:hypothetical protein